LIKAYGDHIWVSNPGGLLEGITVDELKKLHKSNKEYQELVNTTKKPQAET